MDDSILAKLAFLGAFIWPVVRRTQRPSPKEQIKALIPALSLEVVLTCVAGRCDIAWPPILAFHRQLTVTGREWTPLNKAVWVAAGNQPEKRRAKILAVLKTQLDLIQIRLKKTATSHYQVALRGNTVGRV